MTSAQRCGGNRHEHVHGVELRCLRIRLTMAVGVNESDGSLLVYPGGKNVRTTRVGKRRRKIVWTSHDDRWSVAYSRTWRKCGRLAALRRDLNLSVDAGANDQNATAWLEVNGRPEGGRVLGRLGE